MKDRRTVDELSIEELEEIVRLRKREARLERLRRQGKEPNGARDPLAPEPRDPVSPSLPTGHRKYQEVGATAQYRPHLLDDEAEEEEEPTDPRRKIQWGWVRDKSLLVLEITLFFLLLVSLANLWGTTRALNRESREEQQAGLVTATPTPVIPVAILPGGHTPPDSEGRSEPEPIPPHLQEQVSASTPRPVPTPGPERGIRIEIPSIGVDAPIVEGDDPESLKQGAGHNVYSAHPGERGNCVISAHNDIFGEIFRDLPDVELGDEVHVHTVTNEYRYVVTQKRVIEPTEVSVMYPTSSPVLTLISCYPYGIDTHRIVVVAELQP